MVHVPRIVDIDVTDARLRDYRDLTDVALRRVREPAEGLYIAESPKVIRRAIAAGHTPRSALVLAERRDEVAHALAPWPDVPLFVGEPAALESITGFHLHRGALASFERPHLPTMTELLSESRTVVVCEDIVDHTNVGAIFRSVAGMGADAVLISAGCADPLYRRSIRVSMGAVFQVPWTRMTTWARCRETLHDHGFTIAALALSADAEDIAAFVADRPERVALLLGTEGDGLSSSAVDMADRTIRIPMSGAVDSLNVASASAVALYALREG